MGSAREIAQDCEENEDDEPEPKPGGTYPGPCGFIGRPLACGSDAGPGCEWQRRDEQCVEAKGGFNMTMQQLVRGSQSPAARAEQTRRFVERASWVKAKMRRIEEVEDGRAGEQQRGR